MGSHRQSEKEQLAGKVRLGLYSGHLWTLAERQHWVELRHS